jgi:hypothetical protein
LGFEIDPKFANVARNRIQTEAPVSNAEAVGPLFDLFG